MTDTGESSSSDVVTDADASTTDKSTTGTVTAAIATDANTTVDTEKISREDLIELIRAVKFKNPDFSQRQVYNEIVTEIPTRFPQYATSLNPERLVLNDVKKAWKRAILQQQQQQESNSNNGNADLAQRLRTMTTNPQLYTIGLDNNNSNNNDNDKASTGSSNNSAAAAREYVAKFLEEEQVENSTRERELMEDYVHVFLDVPGDSSVAKKPHQALINFQNTPSTSSANASTTKSVAKSGNTKKKKGEKKKPAPAPIALQKPVADANNNATAAPFEDAIVVKIQMAAPIDANDTAKHPMLLYDKSRAYKTFVHPEGAMTMAAATEDAPATKSKRKDDDGYSRLAHWIRTQGIGGALGSTGGTKAYFYGRLTKADEHNKILSIYVKELAPAEGQDF